MAGGSNKPWFILFGVMLVIIIILALTSEKKSDSDSGSVGTDVVLAQDASGARMSFQSRTS